MKRGLRVLVGLNLILSLVLAVVCACGGGATPTATTPTATTPGATTPGATTPAKTTTAPTPAKAGTVTKWRFQHGSSAGTPNWWIFQRFCKEVEIASGGRLIIELFPVGAIVSQEGIFDAVLTGAIECGGGFADCNYGGGKDMRFELSAQIAGNLTPLGQICWRFYENEAGPGTEQILVKKLADKFNIHHIPMGTFVSEAEYIANKPLLKPADFKGLTFRGTGWSQLTVTDFGGKGVYVPSSDVYSALQTGVIDACELGNPYNNYKQGYNDICKYTGFPGIHKLSEATSLWVNGQVWEKLPADLQKIVEGCAARFVLTNLAWLTVESAMTIPKLIEKGIVITYETPEMQDLWRTTSWKLADAEAAKDPEFKEWWEALREFQIMIDRYLDLQTPDYGPNYPGSKETIKGIQGLGQ